jgi:hypothetical protein
MARKTNVMSWGWGWMITAVMVMVVATAQRYGNGVMSDSSPEYDFLADDAAVDAFAQVILESGGVIEGDMEIGEDVTSLKGLEGLVEVTGRLIVNNHIERGFFLDRPGRLGFLHGLESLETVGGDLIILLNPSLLSLRGLDSLKTVGGVLRLYGNGNLQSLSGLESLERVGELLITEEYNLQSLAALSNLKEIEGDVGIWANANLISLEDAFEGMTRLGGGLFIFGNDKLASLSGLEGLDTIEGTLTISKNNQLESLSGLDGLTQIGKIGAYIEDNKNLESLKGLENLREVRGYLGIRGNPNLASLDALANLERVDESVSLEKNPKLLSEAGLENVMTVGGGHQDLNTVADFSGSLLQEVASAPVVVDQVDVLLILEDNAAIAAVGDFVSKRGGVFSESLKITGSDVTSVENLLSLTRVDGDLYITDTRLLASLAGLQALAEVRGDLQILRNDRLTSLVGLEGLTSVAGELYFDVDDSSDAAAGLASLISTGEGLDVYGSDTLAPFAALFGEPILQSLQSLPDLIDKVDILLVLEDDEMVSAVGDFVATRGGVFPGNLEITGDVTSLQGLEALTEVRGHLDISENPQLTSLAGLENLRSVGDYFWVIDHDQLTSLDDSLQSLESVGSDLVFFPENLEMEHSDLLASLATLDYVGGDCDIYWNDNFKPIFSCEELRDESYQPIPIDG